MAEDLLGAPHSVPVGHVIIPLLPRSLLSYLLCIRFRFALSFQSGKLYYRLISLYVNDHVCYPIALLLVYLLPTSP